MLPAKNLRSTLTVWRLRVFENDPRRETFHFTKLQELKDGRFGKPLIFRSAACYLPWFLLKIKYVRIYLLKQTVKSQLNTLLSIDNNYRALKEQLIEFKFRGELCAIFTKRFTREGWSRPVYTVTHTHTDCVKVEIYEEGKVSQQSRN